MKEILHFTMSLFFCLVSYVFHCSEEAPVCDLGELITLAQLPHTVPSPSPSLRDPFTGYGANFLQCCACGYKVRFRLGGACLRASMDGLGGKGGDRREGRS
jgi:hypothetical protein